MSEREFEIYLTLLTRLLKLSPRQRQAIEQELRAHLEERLEDLLARGHSRDEAIAAALEEFGDTAGLADEFTRVARTARLRRRIMQTSIGTIAAAAAIILAVTFLLPEQRPGVPDQPRAQAQEEQPELDADAIADAPVVGVGDTLDDPLSQRISLDISMTPVSAIAHVAQKLDLNFHVNERAIREAFDGDHPKSAVNMELDDVQGKTALDLIIHGEPDLAYLVRDNVLVVTTTGEVGRRAVTRVYEVSDLAPPSMNPYANMLRDQLTDAMTLHLPPNHIAIYDGLLVVNADPARHQEVERTIQMLREAKQVREQREPEPQDANAAAAVR